MPHPGGFTDEFTFRRCPGCGERNLVRDGDFTCAICTVCVTLSSPANVISVPELAVTVPVTVVPSRSSTLACCPGLTRNSRVCQAQFILLLDRKSSLRLMRRI